MSMMHGVLGENLHHQMCFIGRKGRYDNPLHVLWLQTKVCIQDFFILLCDYIFLLGTQVVEWLVHKPRSSEVVGSNLGSCLPVWNVHVAVWGFLDHIPPKQTKTLHRGF